MQKRNPCRKRQLIAIGDNCHIDTRELDLETGRHAPFGLSRAKGSYWAPDKTQGD